MNRLLPLLLSAAAPLAFAGPQAVTEPAPEPARCPAAAEQLSDYLASARQRIGQEGEVRVEYEVDARGRAQLLSVDGTRRYRTPVRIAVDSLDCQRGTPQRYVLNIRFTEPPRAGAAASATFAQASAPR